MAQKPQRAEVMRVASVLVAVGSVLLIVLGIVGVLGVNTNVAQLGIHLAAGGLFSLVLGIVALVLNKSLRTLAVQVILLVIGLLAGGLGGDLVVVGAVIALIVNLL
jgi:hypothetical protein